MVLCGFNISFHISKDIRSDKWFWDRCNQIVIGVCLCWVGTLVFTLFSVFSYLHLKEIDPRSRRWSNCYWCCIISKENIGIHTFLCIHIYMLMLHLKEIDLRSGWSNCYWCCIISTENIGIHALRPVCSLRIQLQYNCPMYIWEWTRWRSEFKRFKRQTSLWEWTRCWSEF